MLSENKSFVSHLLLLTEVFSWSGQPHAPEVQLGSFRLCFVQLE